jgi:hypothetical protein
VSGARRKYASVIDRQSFVVVIVAANLPSEMVNAREPRKLLVVD